MASRILPKMVSVSRNCGITTQLNKIFEEKLSKQDLDILHRWLMIVEEETNLDVSREKRKIRPF